jgi:S1-C subfamily serine protease
MEQTTNISTTSSSATDTQTSTNTTDVLRSFSNILADAVEHVASALVQVNGRRRQPASGIVYAQDLVLTADHVLEREEDITVQTHDKRTLPAQFLGRDLGTDLAVLRVPNLNIDPATFASEVARVGQLIVAVGRTSDEGPMASSGIVSALGGPVRSGRGARLERYIRTDAIPYPGFSGGALIDTQGHVLGVLTTGLFNGVTLAVPHDIAKTTADTLASQGYIKRGYLGISSQFIRVPQVQRAGSVQEYGLLLVKVEENSPAQQGGLLVGDILLSLDGNKINDAEDLPLMLTGERVGKTVPVEVIRGNALQTVQVIVVQRQ